MQLHFTVVWITPVVVSQTDEWVRVKVEKSDLLTRGTIGETMAKMCRSRSSKEREESSTPFVVRSHHQDRIFVPNKDRGPPTPRQS